MKRRTMGTVSQLQFVELTLCISKSGKHFTKMPQCYSEELLEFEAQSDTLCVVSSRLFFENRNICKGHKIFFT
jgi:hypothetical protein